MHESSISGHQNHMQAFLCRTASHLQKRAIPAALTRESILGSVVELHNCGNFDVDSLPYATKVRGLCEIPDVMLDFTTLEISAPILVATAASHTANAAIQISIMMSESSLCLHLHLRAEATDVNLPRAHLLFTSSAPRQSHL
jgi:hypothetical protein